MRLLIQKNAEKSMLIKRQQPMELRVFCKEAWGEPQVAITGFTNCSKIKLKLMILLPKLGGFRIPIFSKSTEFEFLTMLMNEVTVSIKTQQRQHSTTYFKRKHKKHQKQNKINETSLLAIKSEAVTI